tara:strand:+ start:3292 stop:3654 length:363 start_codon:yes stop_codon:yes gene_type:complete
MTALDTKLLNEVYSIAELYGKDVTFTTRSSTYDPTTGKSTVVSTSHAVRVTPPAPFKSSFSDGKLIKHGDVSVLLPAKLLTFTPSLSASVTIDGSVFTIIALDSLYSGANIAAYDLQLRQ